MTAKKAAKTPRSKRTKTTGISTGIERVPQPHGGALNAGGTPGNIGGTGRPPSQVRAASRIAYYDRIPILEQIADDKNAANPERIAAIKTLGGFGLSGAISVDDVRERLGATLAQIRAALPADDAESLIARIRPIWVPAS